MPVLSYPIIPIGKPRMTRSDRWRKRPCVLRYRAFADEVRLRGVTLEPGDAITFILPMPQSWSLRQRMKMDGQAHEQKPDIDNLVKALMDAVHKDDARIHWLRDQRKVWGTAGGIVITRPDESD